MNEKPGKGTVVKFEWITAQNDVPAKYLTQQARVISTNWDYGFIEIQFQDGFKAFVHFQDVEKA